MHLYISLQYRLFQRMVALAAMMGLFFVSASPCWFGMPVQEERAQEIVWQELGTQLGRVAIRPADVRRRPNRLRYRFSIVRKSNLQTLRCAFVVLTERDRMNGLGTYLLT